ncbi:DUF456 domain-containing protein [Bacillus sp. FJAT-44742]|uniref:DUF456 domain-containing protein n=1 Tax=Bacillus sp. FJAT-44742 TaxID=2014005 RepID=UPI000C242502|nr:DUF456 domain-containing protein [Bacillus sp. FJAT-44742]
MEGTLMVLAAIFYLLAFAGLVYPVIPAGVVFAVSLLLIGWAEGFGSLGIFFWVIQGFVAFLLFAIDSLISIFGVKRSGGSNAALWGSAIGLIVGPFIIPVVGVLVGALAGAVIGELITGGKTWRQMGKVGLSSVVGFVLGVIVKGMILVMNLGYLLWVLLF